MTKTWAITLLCQRTCLKVEEVKTRASCLISFTAEPTTDWSSVLELILCTKETQSEAKITWVSLSSCASRTARWRAKASAISGSKEPVMAESTPTPDLLRSVKMAACGKVKAVSGGNRDHLEVEVRSSHPGAELP